MAFDDNPDEVFDNEPEAEADVEGNGDEQSNRTFRYAMIGMFALGGIGVLLIALILIGRGGERSATEAYNRSVQQTNDAVAQLAQTPPTPLPTDTPIPTNTATPTGTPTIKPSPTTAPTQASSVVTGTGTITSTVGTPQATTASTGKGTAIAQVQKTAAANATKPAGTKATSIPGSPNVTVSPKEATAAAAKGLTNTQTISGTTGTGSTGLPTTGAGDNLVIWLVAAVGLVGVLVVARRLRTAQS